MALYVNTNVSSINAQRKLANSTLALNTSCLLYTSDAADE